MDKLNAGTELSYSAGRNTLDPYAYRIVRPSGGRISSVLSAFPQLKDLFSNKPPLIISCYPASLGSFDNAIMIDTYLRPKAVTRALLLAAQENITAILAGQPLSIAEFLLGHLQSGYELPRLLLFSIGGYICPRSLENFLIGLVNDSDSQAGVLYAYGVAEVEYGCMMGVDRTELGEVIYYPVTSYIVPKVEEGKLMLHFNDGGHEKCFDTGDLAEPYGKGLIIRNATDRMNYALMANLECWEDADWRRRTGYVKKVQNRYIYQIRQQETNAKDDEIQFWQFAERFGFSWLDKPDWS